MHWQRIRQIIKKEFIQVRRDRRMLGLIIISPIFQLIVFGYAVTTDIRHVPTAIVDADWTRQSRDLTAKFGTSGYFDLKYRVARPQDLAPLLDADKAEVGIWIPKGFAKNLARGKRAPFQIVIDGTDSTSAGTVLGYTTGIVGRFSEEALAERVRMMGGSEIRLPGIDLQTRVWYNPDLKSVNYMVPGVLCMILLVVTMILTSMAIVKEREVGTLEQLIVTPIKPRELMIAKVIPFIVIGFLDVFLILLVARFWFLVPVAGSVVLLLALTTLFLMTSLGMGLFISTISRTQQQAMMSSYFIMLPSILLSGFMFPIENMPRAIQYITYLIPLRYFLRIIRGIFLKGSGIGILWPQVVVLFVLGAAILTLSSLRFTKKMA